MAACGSLRTVGQGPATAFGHASDHEFAPINPEPEEKPAPKPRAKAKG